MPTSMEPKLVRGRVYRTHELARWAANPSRLARRLVDQGRLEPLAKGLFLCPRKSRFGAVPAADEELLKRFLDGAPFIMTGPPKWNALGLGTTAVFPIQLVYNTKRSGHFELDGRKFWLRRVAFPKRPTAEWYLVDLFEHYRMAGTSLEQLEKALATALAKRRFDPANLMAAAKRFGTRRTQVAIKRAMQVAGPSS